MSKLSVLVLAPHLPQFFNFTTFILIFQAKRTLKEKSLDESMMKEGDGDNEKEAKVRKL